VTHLGPDLPADDIAAAARQAGARAIALGLVFPADDPELPGQLERLRRAIGPELPVLVFGGAVSAYARAIDTIGAERVAGVAALRVALGRLRRPSGIDVSR
jgi:thiamine monophosphate synthase